ncbi:hypothetical protein NHX12_016790 [Muraenolepis orangiensis]|uniref:Uncharacterized protein n=1 Tax=Muraenolepis orangiensis TaxID=630683 RepID=A0A9Q0I1F6_9TELE|nr:hypothetical protein NHX12_016790 [Muraenolepis orangiensis]
MSERMTDPRLQQVVVMSLLTSHVTLTHDPRKPPTAARKVAKMPVKFSSRSGPLNVKPRRDKRDPVGMDEGLNRHVTFLSSLMVEWRPGLQRVAGQSPGGLGLSDPGVQAQTPGVWACRTPGSRPRPRGPTGPDPGVQAQTPGSRPRPRGPGPDPGVWAWTPGV